MGTWLQAVGLVAVAVGVGVIYWPAGIITGGVCCVLWGLAMAGDE